MNKDKKQPQQNKKKKEFELWLCALVHVAACQHAETMPLWAESAHASVFALLLFIMGGGGGSQRWGRAPWLPPGVCITPRPDNARSEPERRRCHSAA